MSTNFNNSYKVFVYLTIYNTIQYTVKKIIMKKSIYDRSHVLTIMPIKSKDNRQSMFGTMLTKSKDNTYRMLGIVFIFIIYFFENFFLDMRTEKPFFC